MTQYGHMHNELATECPAASLRPTHSWPVTAGAETGTAANRGHRLTTANTAAPAMRIMNRATTKPAREASRCVITRVCSSSMVLGRFAVVVRRKNGMRLLACHLLLGSPISHPAQECPKYENDHSTDHCA